MAKKVLLVDDSPTALLMGEMILRKKTAYDVVTAKDGMEAVQRAASDAPDIILMDVVMPQMTGLQACAALRENPATREIPVIMLTTKSGEADFEKGYASGCNDYLTKPMNGPELVEMLKAYLGE